MPDAVVGEVEIGGTARDTEKRDFAGRHRVVAAILVSSDAVLLCHRSADRQWYPDTWDLPGGHIEEGETPENALVRELREELGISLAEPLGRHSFYRATDELEMWVWTAGEWIGDPSNRAPDEHDEIGWLTAQDVLSLRLADPAYSGWIAEALAPVDPDA